MIGWSEKAIIYEWLENWPVCMFCPSDESEEPKNAPVAHNLHLRRHGMRRSGLGMAAGTADQDGVANDDVVGPVDLPERCQERG